MSINLTFQRPRRNWYILLPLFFLLFSCKSKEAINDNTYSTEEKEATTLSENMKMGVIVDYSQKSDECGFLIELENEDIVLQALKIPEEFKKDGIYVWINYTLSRRQQGPCIYGNPIIINEIIARK